MRRSQVISGKPDAEAISITLQNMKRWRLLRHNQQYRLPKNKKYAPGALLIAAAKNGSLSQVKALLRQGIPIDVPNESGETALSAAASRGKASIVAWLLARGAKANRVDEWGDTPLMQALSTDGNERTTRLLLHHGAKPRAYSAGETALHRAAGTASWRIVRLLLEAGAKADARTHRQETPLHQAAFVSDGDVSERIKVARLLLQRGADANARDYNGRTPLHNAAIGGSAAMVRLLLEAGSDVNAEADDGWRSKGTTPLHNVASIWRDDPEERVHAARLLVAVGANLLARTENDDTPLTFAARSGNPQMVAFLLSRGANPNDKVCRGASAIELARSQTGRPASAAERERYEQVIALLMDAC